MSGASGSPGPTDTPIASGPTGPPLRPAHDPLRQRHRRDPLGRLASQEPWLHFGYQLGELVPVSVVQLARTSTRDADQLKQSPPLGGSKPQDVIAGQQSNLGDRDQSEDGEPA